MGINSKLHAFLAKAAAAVLLSFAFIGLASAEAATTTLPYTGDPIDFYTVPAGVTSMTVTLIGAGGGAGGGAYSFGGGGGGAGASFTQVIPVTPGQTIAYVIGTAGTGGASGFINLPGGNGTDGTNTTFGTTTALGGKGGKGAIYGDSSSGKGGLAGGVGGTNGGNGDVQINTQRNYGGNGGQTVFSTTTPVGGFGNASTYTLPAAGTNGNGGGAGSGWASGDGVHRDAGANGGNGLIVLSYTQDLVPPVLSLLGANPLFLNASSTGVYVDPGATATDAVYGPITPVIIFNNVNLAATGTYSVVWSATDPAGNVATTSRTVIVQDITAPVITAPATQVFEATGPITTPVLIPAIATDDFSSTTVVYSPLSFPLGTTTVLWTGSDTSGNIATTTSLVIIKDTTAPSIVLNGLNPMSVLYGTTFTDPGATAYDLVSGTTTVSATGSVNTFATGTYQIIYTSSDALGNTATATRTVDVVATAPVLTTLSIAPLNPTFTVGSTTTFVATTLDQYGNPFASTVFWGPSNPSVGTIGFNTGAFAALSAGTTTITAIAGSLSTSTLVTVVPVIATSTPSAVMLINSTLGGTFFGSYNPTLAETVIAPIATTTGTTTVTNSTFSTFWNVNNTNATNTSINDVNLDAVNVTNSTLINSDIARCTIINSSIKNYFATDCYVAFSILDPSTLYSFVNSTSTASQIYASNISFSTIDHSYVATSTITNSTISYSTSTLSTISSSTIQNFSNVNNSTVNTSTIDSSTVSTSTLTNVNSTGSTITNTTLSNATTTNAVIDNNTIQSGTITIGGTTFTISTSTPLSALVEYAPVAGFTASSTGLQVSLTDTTTDANEGTGIPESWTYAWDFGDGATTTIAATSTSGDTAHTYAGNGTYTISLSVTDAYNQTSSTSTQITVSTSGTSTPDTIAPVITILGSNPITYVASTTQVYVDAGATANDNVDGNITANIATSSNVNLAVVGSYQVVYSVSDLAGNAASSTRVVNVVSAPDTIAPVITILGANPATVIVGTTYTDQGATANDNVDGNITANIVTTNNVNSNALGSYTVDYSVTDGAGNTATSSRTVNVVNAPDTIAPVITILGSNPITILVGATYTDAGATANDNVDGNITANIATSTNLNVNTPGAYQVTYTVSDAAGNGATSTRTVNVVATPDTTAPVITILGSNPATIIVGTTYTDAGATANDNVDGNITANIITTNNVNNNAVGTYTVDYSVTDGAGNTASSSRTVNVISAPIDNVPPVITIIGGTPITVTVGSTYTDQGATANDNVDGNITANIVTTGLPVNTSATGTFSVVYTVSDNANNTAVATRTVNVIAAPADNIPPVITITGGTPTTVVQGSTYTDQGATANDNVDGNVPVITLSNNVDTATIGSYQVVYQATDTANNIATATRDVNVVVAPADTIPPVITLNGGTPVTLTQGSTYTELGATANDNVDGPITPVITGTVDTSTIGTYIVTYTATDSSNNVASTTRTVNVIAPDTTAPVITILGANPMTITIGGTYTELGASAIDNIDGPITPVITGSVNTSATGTYSIVYTATDSSNNSASSTRTVNVVATSTDTVPPVITILGANPASITVGSTYTDAGATANDNVDGNITANIVTTNAVNNNVVGTYTVTYFVSDAAGNGATSTRTVNVTSGSSSGGSGGSGATGGAGGDTTPPVITILGENPVTIAVGSTYTDAGATANDTHDGVVAVTVIGNTVDTSVPGTYHVDYAARDASMNWGNATRVVIVTGSSTSGGTGGTGTSTSTSTGTGSTGGTTGTTGTTGTETGSGSGTETTVTGSEEGTIPFINLINASTSGSISGAGTSATKTAVALTPAKGLGLVATVADAITHMPKDVIIFILAILLILILGFLLSRRDNQ